MKTFKQLTDQEKGLIKLLYSRGMGIERLKARFKVGREHIQQVVSKTEKGQRGLVVLEKKAANGGVVSQFQFARLSKVGNSYIAPRDKNTVRICCKAWLKTRGYNWECKFEKVENGTLVTRIS